MYDNDYKSKGEASEQDDWENRSHRKFLIRGTNPWEWPPAKVELMVLLCRLLDIEFTVQAPPRDNGYIEYYLLAPWNLHSRLRRAKNYEST